MRCIFSGKGNVCMAVHGVACGIECDGLEKDRAMCPYWGIVRALGRLQR